MRTAILFSGSALAVLTLVPGCGGDDETTTVAGGESTVTTTVTVPAAIPAEPNQAGEEEGSQGRPGRGEEREKPNGAAQSGADAPLTRQQARTRLRSAIREGRGPILGCIRKHGLLGQGGRPESLRQAKKARQRVRSCIRKQVGPAVAPGP